MVGGEPQAARPPPLPANPAASPPRPGPKSLHFSASQIWTKGEDLVVTHANIPWPTVAEAAGGAAVKAPPTPSAPAPGASSFAVASAVLPHSPHAYSLFAVFDGHAGAAAARHCAREVAAAVHAALPPGGPPASEREGCSCADCCGGAPAPTEGRCAARQVLNHERNAIVKFYAPW